MGDPPSPVNAGQERFGLAAALTCSLGLGAAIAIARLAYDTGADGLSIAWPRTWLLVLLLLGFVWLTGRRLRLPRSAWPHCLGAGAMLAYMFYGNIAAVAYVPAPVVALLFFIYPPLTTLLVAVLDRKWPSLGRLAAVGLAFAGLAVMLGASLGGLDWRGVALAGGAGAMTAVNVVWVARRLGAYDAVVVMTYMSVVAACCLTVVAIALGGPPWPTATSGWAALAAAAVLQAVSIPLFYVALPLIGPERSGVLNNLQPVATIVVAYLVLGEAMQPVQFLGGAMILGGVLLMQIFGRNR